MQQDGRDEKALPNDARLHAQDLRGRRNLWSRWPWGVTALAVILAGWVGIYLLWNGVVFLFSL